MKVGSLSISLLLYQHLFLTPSFAVCIIHNMKSKELIKLLESNGWVLRGVKGSHHMYTHPSKVGHVSVPHPKNDLGVGLVHKLLKQAGIKQVTP